VDSQLDRLDNLPRVPFTVRDDLSSARMFARLVHGELDKDSPDYKTATKSAAYALAAVLHAAAIGAQSTIDNYESRQKVLTAIDDAFKSYAAAEMEIIRLTQGSQKVQCQLRKMHRAFDEILAHLRDVVK
jgi:hypothetical protein